MAIRPNGMMSAKETKDQCIGKQSPLQHIAYQIESWMEFLGPIFWVIIVKILRPQQSGWHFTDHIFTSIFKLENCCILIQDPL